MIRAFLYFIRNKINPVYISSQSQLKSTDIATGIYSNSPYSKKEDIPGTVGVSQKEITEEKKTVYIGIENDDLSQRIHHNICNLIGLDTDELAYIEEMDCKSMFEIIKLLNKAMVSFIDGIMEID